MTLSVKDTLWKPHVRKAVHSLDEKFPGYSWGTYPGHDPVESLAADAMVPNWNTAAGRALGDKLAEYIWDKAKALGVWYLIWNGRIISRTRPDAGWLPYFNRNSADPSKAHKNHVHVSFYAAEPEVEYLPTRTVTEGLWAAHQTKPSKWRDVGYKVSTIVKVEGGWGRTESGFIYPLKYLSEV